MATRYLLGFDVGSSSVKASLVNADSGKCVSSAFFPEKEAPIQALKAGWAEQEPDSWWQYAKQGLQKIMAEAQVKGDDIAAIGISYQMHGLVCVDKDLKPLRPAIIWCDSRAVPYGERAFRDLGADRCLSHLLNSPGNFTAAKLAWVKENEPDIFGKIYKIMLPGDYIAMRLSGVANTTVSGLSEGMFWDFKANQVAHFLLDYYGIPASFIPDIVPTFSEQSVVSEAAAAELGLKAGTPITYRGGDQPNNALSLNVFEPGEIAATAGTSGVVYGVLGEVNYDPKSRVNTFAHVNHQLSNLKPQTSNLKPQTRLGVLLCINGTGILNAWMHRNVTFDMGYAEMNDLAAQAPIGSDGVCIMPFGNGAERVLQNKELGCSIHGLNFNKHNRSHLVRAAQEGIVFSFCYGMEIMQQMGMDIRKIHAGKANMFLSPLFRNTLAGVSGATIELYETDGSVGAAKGAGMGAGIYSDHNDAFATLEKLQVIEPAEADRAAYAEAYARWKETLAALSK
jgi:xylulokinase